MKKDAEAEKRFGELRVKTLEDTVSHQQAQIATLEKQLADAKQQVQDIAVKAIEGASGARALSHINQIAMEQAEPGRRDNFGGPSVLRCGAPLILYRHLFRMIDHHRIDRPFLRLQLKAQRTQRRREHGSVAFQFALF